MLPVAVQSPDLRTVGDKDCAHMETPDTRRTGFIFLLPWKKTSYLLSDPDIAERAKKVQTFFYLWWCLEQTPFIKELTGNNSSPAWPWVLCPPVKAKQICPKPGARRSFHHRTYSSALHPQCVYQDSWASQLHRNTLRPPWPRRSNIKSRDPFSRGVLPFKKDLQSPETRWGKRRWEGVYDINDITDNDRER